MTKEEAKYFNTLNKQWERLKPYVNDTSVYKRIMQDLIKMFFKNTPPEFTDEWWQKVVASFLKYHLSYTGTAYESFAAELSMGFLDYWEKIYKLNCDDNVFEEIMKSVVEGEISRVGAVHMEK